MEKLVKKAIDGDKDAFSKLIVLVQNDLYRIAKIRLMYEDDVNEAVQNTIVNSYVSIHKLREIKYFKTWIIKILINECNHIYKERKNYFIEYNENEIKKMSKDYLDDCLSNIDFIKLINNLNYEERLIVTLFYAEDLTVKQISKILDMSQSTVRTKLFRARKKLKKILEGGIVDG